MAKQSRCEDCMNYVYDESTTAMPASRAPSWTRTKWPNSCAGTTLPVRSYHPGESDYYLSSKQ